MENEKEVPEYISTRVNGAKTVITPLLAKHIRHTHSFFTLRGRGRSAPHIYQYRDGVYRATSEDAVKKLIKGYFILSDVENLATAGAVNDVYNTLRVDFCEYGDGDVNADESYINFQNGILEIKKDENGKIVPRLLNHSVARRGTVQIPCNWAEGEVQTPVFDSYLDTLCRKDGEKKRLILEFMGAVFSNVYGYRMKKALFLIGPGNTGKSRLYALCAKILGDDNYTSADLGALEERFGTSSLYGKRLAGSADASCISLRELANFKKLTGGDSIHAEFKGADAFDFTYRGMIIMCMNELPRFGGDNGRWVYERIVPVRCDNVIAEDERDKELDEKLYAEREGVVKKAVTAFFSVIENGYRFSPCAAADREREKYIKKGDSVQAFFEECMTKRPHDKIEDNCTTGRLYRVYKAWCAENFGGSPKSNLDFRDGLSRNIGQAYSECVTRLHGQSYLTDYTLNLEAKELYKNMYGFDRAL